MLSLILFLIFFAVVAMTFNEGMWANAIRLINVVTAGLLAMNFFEPLAQWLDDWEPSYTYAWDFLSLWLCFAIFHEILRLFTDRLSTTKVRFLKMADRIGGGVLAVWVGWFMICFTLMSLHTAPLDRNFLSGGFLTGDDARMVLGLAPDRQLLGFMQKSSVGVFSRSEENAFDPNGEFMPKYATRRTQNQKNIEKTQAVRVP
jgi:hypothetical protein